MFSWSSSSSSSSVQMPRDPVGAWLDEPTPPLATEGTCTSCAVAVLQPQHAAARRSRRASLWCTKSCQLNVLNVLVIYYLHIYRILHQGSYVCRRPSPSDESALFLWTTLWGCCPTIKFKVIIHCYANRYRKVEQMTYHSGQDRSCFHLATYMSRVIVCRVLVLGRLNVSVVIVWPL
jgi:hypothetical protein